MLKSRGIIDGLVTLCGCQGEGGFIYHSDNNSVVRKRKVALIAMTCHDRHDQLGVGVLLLNINSHNETRQKEDLQSFLNRGKM